MEKRKRARDVNRRKVYAAERVLFARHDNAFCLTYNQMIEFTCRVLHNPALQEVWPIANWPCKIKDGRGRRRACGASWGISVPTAVRHKGMVLHELAHFIEDVLWTGEAWHGPRWVAIYLTLVQHCWDDPEHPGDAEEATRELAASFLAAGIATGQPKRKRGLAT